MALLWLRMAERSARTIVLGMYSVGIPSSCHLIGLGKFSYTMGPQNGGFLKNSLRYDNLHVHVIP